MDLDGITQPAPAPATPHRRLQLQIPSPRGVRVDLVTAVSEFPKTPSRSTILEPPPHSVNCETQPHAHSETGRTSMELLPRFQTISYRELWDRVVAVASALAGHLGVAGRSRVCAGFHGRRLRRRTLRWSRVLLLIPQGSVQPDPDDWYFTDDRDYPSNEVVNRLRPSNIDCIARR
jgi:hypothetical protein